MRTDIYEDSTISTLEKLILAESVKFELPTKPILAKFNVPLMMPTTESGNAISNTNAKMKSSNFVKLYIPRHLLWGFIKPTVAPLTLTPATGSGNGIVDKSKLKSTPVQSICIPSSTTIPKGTVFLGEYLGGKKDITMMQVIGIYTDSINDE